MMHMKSLQRLVHLKLGRQLVCSCCYCYCPCLSDFLWRPYPKPSLAKQPMPVPPHPASVSLSHCHLCLLFRYHLLFCGRRASQIPHLTEMFIPHPTQALVIFLLQTYQVARLLCFPSYANGLWASHVQKLPFLFTVQGRAHSRFLIKNCANEWMTCDWPNLLPHL